jgi:hypothetical protein
MSYLMNDGRFRQSIGNGDGGVKPRNSDGGSELGFHRGGFSGIDFDSLMDSTWKERRPKATTLRASRDSSLFARDEKISARVARVISTADVYD